MVLSIGILIHIRRIGSEVCSYFIMCWFNPLFSFKFICYHFRNSWSCVRATVICLYVAISGIRKRYKFDWRRYIGWCWFWVGITTFWYKKHVWFRNLTFYVMLLAIVHSSSLFSAAPIPKSIENIELGAQFVKRFDFNIKDFLCFLFIGSLWSYRSLFSINLAWTLYFWFFGNFQLQSFSRSFYFLNFCV